MLLLVSVIAKARVWLGLLVQTPLFAELAALHEGLQAACEVLQHVVHGAAFVHQGGGQPQQEAAFARRELPREGAADHGLPRVKQSRRLNGVGQQPPEGGEGPAGVALSDNVDAGEELLQHLAATAVVLDQALA